MYDVNKKLHGEINKKKNEIKIMLIFEGNYSVNLRIHSKYGKIQTRKN